MNPTILVTDLASKLDAADVDALIQVALDDGLSGPIGWTNDEGQVVVFDDDNLRIWIKQQTGRMPTKRG